MGQLRFAILGAGHIAGKMARTLDFLRGEVRPYAVASRDIGRARAIADECGFDKAYGSYEEMLADGDVDVVYVATPNNLHVEHALACLAHGKHVLCEKPFAMSADGAQRVFDEAARRGLFAMEAMWTRFQPAARLIREVISSGEIGHPRYLQATFGLNIAAKERVARPELGGGALLDLGIYPLNFASMHFDLPDEFWSGATISRATLLGTGVDDQSSITIDCGDGRLACLSTSVTAAMGAYGRIAGTLGCIEVPALTRCEGFIVRSIPSGDERRVECPFDFNGYEYEVRAVARALAEGRTECPEMPWAETMRMTRAMEALRAAWGCQSNARNGLPHGT